MTYVNIHLKELKFSLIYSLFSLFFTIMVIYEYIDIFLSFYIFLTNTSINFIFTDITEVFYINIKLAILFGFILGMPSVIMIIWLFVKSGLYRWENKLVLLFYMSYYFIVIPYVIYIVPHISIKIIDYLNHQSYNNFEYYHVELLQRFNNFYILIYNLNLFGVLFILTLVTLLLMLPYYKSKIQLLNIIKKQRKFIYFLLLIILAILTPPDILSLIILFIPLFIILECIIIIICIYKNI